MICSSVYESPVGRLRVIEKDGFIIRVFFDNGTAENYASCSPSALTEKTVSRLEEYFLSKRRDFDLPLSFAAATPFRQNVWNELLKIPYGSTVSYGGIASAIGNPKASRAVGSAVHDNPFLIIVPCHRVVGSDGSLTGFAAGLEVKRFLLEFEMNK